MRSIVTVVCLALFIPGITAPQTETPESVAGILEAEGLVAAYNPVLLDYLLEEGRNHLAEAPRTEAIDQVVTALKKDIDITPEEQRTAALAAAGAGLAQLFGNRDAGDLGDAAQGATFQIWKGWVDSAFTLQRAGYEEQANAFFEKCIEIYPYTELRGRCAVGLAAGQPDEAFDRLMALTDADIDTANAALRILGRMAGDEGFPEAKRTQVIQRLEEFTGGMKKASYGLAACQGLVATGDSRAVPTLKKLAKGMMNVDFHHCARSGLLLTFDDRSVVPLLEKQLKGGTFDTTEPYEKTRAAELLMRADEEAGFRFAEEELAEKQKKGLAKFMQSEDDKVDLRPALVASLVRVGGDRSLGVLQKGFDIAPPDSWLRTWIAIGLAELGDASHLDLLRRALGSEDWEFTTVRIATALANHGDSSGIPALDELYDQAVRGIPPTGGEIFANMMGYGETQEQKERRLLRLREQIATALGTIDHPDAVPVLEAILADSEPPVRIASAYALADMTDPAALGAIEKALDVDYGTVGDSPRTPVVRAYLVRSAAARFPSEDATNRVLTAGTSDPYMSVRFLSLAVQEADKG